jgi:BirA family transcriptional regulator, biotin operon repressor / biotin---[acetyl-CoA-carboxylase] ligase
MQIISRKRVGSTNAEALALATKGCLEWTIVVADEQTAGRGRNGKFWDSPPGGLWCSVVLRPNIASGTLPLIQFFVANSARRVLERAIGTRVTVKWPNDLIVKGLKVGGILVEARLVDTRIEFAVAGVGINLNVQSSSLPQGATSTFKITGRLLNRDAVLDALLEDLESSYSEIHNKEKIFQDWWENCVHRSKPVTVVRSEGSIAGISTGISTSGYLNVKTSKGNTLEIPEGSVLLS